MKKIVILLSLAATPMAANAVESLAAAPAVAKPVEAAITPPAAPDAATAPAEDGAQAPKAAASKDGSLPGYTPMAPTPGIGMPVNKEIDFQEQFSPTGVYAKNINNKILLPLIVAISLFVLFLLFYVMIRFRKKEGVEPSKTTHNSLIEVVWTIIPVVILLAIAVPSLDLLAKQFKPAPADAVTIKVTGYQWYWGYSYPDHGDFEVVSNMLKEKNEVAAGERFRTDRDGPRLLAVDNRMVVPAGVPLRIQTTAADVIHSFAVPAIWFKLDAVPGRLNEKAVTITKPGVYFGQCSELCGARHGFMPIVVEALPPEKFAAWVKANGGMMPAEIKAKKAAEEAAAKAAAAKAKADAAKAEAAKAAEAPAADAAAAPAAK
nr:cytochrome c oxidase subunit II [Sphingorhabdus lutea]